jgi:ABC-2 type transport system ATP-binding protein
MVAQGLLEDIYRQLQLMRIVHVRLVGADEAVLEKIRKIEGVENVEQQVDRIAIRLRDNPAAVETLHESLCSLGVRIHMFQPEAMDMETAFMKLTEGKTA